MAHRVASIPEAVRTHRAVSTVCPDQAREQGASQELRSDGPARPLGAKHLYVHIPFCRALCAYCDFASEPVSSHEEAGRVAEYVRVLQAELTARAGAAGSARAAQSASPEKQVGVEEHSGLQTAPVLAHDAGLQTGAGLALHATPQTGALGWTCGRCFETIYVGGGTPTVLASDVLLELVGDLALRLAASSSAPADDERRAPLPAPWAEFTVEANPGTIDVCLLEKLRAAGVTRLSLGVQSFVPALRAVLGRQVAQEEIEEALAAVASTAWEDWNIDLMFGIPGQTWRTAAADIDAAAAAQPTHISLYDLTYTRAFRTRVDATVGAGARRAAGAFAENHYADAVARLEAAGYRRYEVSNFALPGHECRHNQAYWRGEDYLGVGASAVSTLGGERIVNPRTVRGYLARRPAQVEALSTRTRLWEKAMLGLRTSEGVDESAVLPVIDQEARDRLLAQGCLQRRYGKIFLDPSFLDVSNTVIGALLVSPANS